MKASCLRPALHGRPMKMVDITLRRMMTIVARHLCRPREPPPEVDIFAWLYFQGSVPQIEPIDPRHALYASAIAVLWAKCGAQPT
jgi:hypothetical protein